jgi:hypothetical protein
MRCAVAAGMSNEWFMLAMPALLTRMSSRPCRLVIDRIISRTWSSSKTSAQWWWYPGSVQSGSVRLHPSTSAPFWT